MFCKSGVENVGHQLRPEEADKERDVYEGIWGCWQCHEYGLRPCSYSVDSNTYEQIYALKAKIHITFWESTYKIHLEIVFGSESYPVKCPSFKVLCPRIQSDAMTIALVNYKPNPTSKVIDVQGHVITPLMKQWDQDHVSDFGQLSFLALPTPGHPSGHQIPVWMLFSLCVFGWFSKVIH